MQYYVRGKSKINLNQNDFIAKGGEGQIFGKSEVIYKIYNDPSKVIPDGKIKELQNLKHINIIIPEDIITDSNNQRIGITMKWVKDTIPLCKLFTNDYRKKVGITKELIIDIIEKIKKTIEFIHTQNCLMVDGNEFNYLLDKNFTPYFIDTNSYQTPTYSATAIMPTIKDYHNNVFSQLTDWFSFAIVSCQLFIGIHPFKGTHPSYKLGELEKRMKDNISVFNKNVTLPSSVRDFSFIPNHYQTWFVELFENGKRIPPPTSAGKFLSVMVKVKSYQNSDAKIRQIKEFDKEILYYNIINGTEIVKTKSSIYINNNYYYSFDIDDEIILTDKKCLPITCKIKHNKLILHSLTSYQIHDIDIECTEKMIINNTLYLKNNGNLIEMSFNDMGFKIIPSVKMVWNIMPNSSILFGGVIYQSVLGKPYLVFPLPDSSKLGSCMYIKINEIDGYRIIDARHDGGVCCLIGAIKGRYDKIILRFDNKYLKYDCRIIEDIDYLSVNFITRDNGTVVMINSEKNIEIFYKQPFNNQIKEIETSLPMPCRLSKDGDRALLFSDNKLYSLD